MIHLGVIDPWLVSSSALLLKHSLLGHPEAFLAASMMYLVSLLSRYLLMATSLNAWCTDGPEKRCSQPCIGQSACQPFSLLASTGSRFLASYAHHPPPFNLPSSRSSFVGSNVKTKSGQGTLTATLIHFPLQLMGCSSVRPCVPPEVFSY